MSDRELLEKAAMAAGIVIVGPVEKFIVQFDERHKGGFIVENAQGGHSAWNPLNDDGDALRLAVAMGFNVYHAAGSVYVELLDEGVEVRVGHESNPCYATRRAIVRAASELA